MSNLPDTMNHLQAEALVFWLNTLKCVSDDAIESLDISSIRGTASVYHSNHMGTFSEIHVSPQIIENINKVSHFSKKNLGIKCLWHISLSTSYSEHTCLICKSIEQKSNGMKNDIFLLLVIMCSSFWTPHMEEWLNPKIFISKVKSLKTKPWGEKQIESYPRQGRTIALDHQQ